MLKKRLPGLPKEVLRHLRQSNLGGCWSVKVPDVVTEKGTVRAADRCGWYLLRPEAVVIRQAPNVGAAGPEHLELVTEFL